MCLHVLLHLLLIFPALYKNSSRKEFVWAEPTISRPKRHTNTKTHNPNAHVLWAPCGCVLHTDASQFLAKARVKPEGKGHRKRKKGRLSASKPERFATWTVEFIQKQSTFKNGKRYEIGWAHVHSLATPEAASLKHTRDMYRLGSAWSAQHHRTLLSKLNTY